MTDVNIIGPFGAGINETTTRPDDIASGSGVDTWFKPCIDNVPETGTKIPAVWLNKIAALLRRAIRGVGVAQAETDDDMLLKCFQKVDKRVDNNDSATGVAVYQGMDVTGLVHLLRKVIGVNGIAVQISADGKRVEIDGTGLGGATFPGNWKLPCRVATIANIADLAAGAPDIVDGVTLVADERVLVWKQTTAAQNGIYRVVTVGSGSNGAWVRATDFDSDGDAAPGSMVVVNEGTAYADSVFQLFTNAMIVLGTTALNWQRVLPVVHSVFGPSGPSHAQGHVPDPGATAGASRFLREDGNWVSPSGMFPIWDGVSQVPVGCYVSAWRTTNAPGLAAGTIINAVTTPFYMSGYTTEGGFGEPAHTINYGNWVLMGQMSVQAGSACLMQRVS